MGGEVTEIVEGVGLDKKVLNQEVYPCAYRIPEDGVIDGYPKLKNSTCDFCADMCEAKFDSSIDFFDGFDSKSSFTFVGVILGLTVLFQVYVQCWKKKTIDLEYEKMLKEMDTDTYTDNMHLRYSERVNASPDQKGTDGEVKDNRINKTGTKDTIN